MWWYGNENVLTFPFLYDNNDEIQQKAIEVVEFSTKDLTNHQFDKNGNIIPNEEESDSLYDDSDDITIDYSLAAHSFQQIIDLLPNRSTVKDTLLFYKPESDEFMQITNAATLLIYMGYFDIYQMKRKRIQNHLERCKEEIR